MDDVTRAGAAHIVAYVRRMGGGVSCVDLERELAAYFPVKGDHAIEVGDYTNLLIWAGVSQQFVQALMFTLTSGEIVPKPAELMVYMVDGKMLTFPIAKQARSYKEPHWLPVTFHPNAQP